MKPITFLLLICIAACVHAQKKVGGGCECCEAIFEQAPDFSVMNNIDTLPDFNEPGAKMLMTGTIYKKDGKTPAANVVLYIYHTDQKGYYTPKPGQTGCAKRHGYIRGWIKTNANGEYKFYTLKPAAYPARNIPAHIHPVIKEPDTNEYYIDEWLFDDDSLLTTEEKNKAENRGGTGIVHLTKTADGTLLCKRDIILGKNIPGY